MRGASRFRSKTLVPCRSSPSDHARARSVIEEMHDEVFDPHLCRQLLWDQEKKNCYCEVLNIHRTYQDIVLVDLRRALALCEVDRQLESWI